MCDNAYEEIRLPAGDEPGPKHAGAGHRARLRQRLLTGGPDSLADYELLEFLLFAGVRQGDTKPVAKALIARFGSFAAVLDADPAAVQEVKGVGEAGAAALKSVGLAARRMARGKISGQPVLSSWQALLDYLTIDMANLNHERVRVLYLNTRNQLILDHLVHEGTVDEGAIYPREVIRKGLDIGATAIILVHNHPSGTAEPSRADIAITNRIAEAGRHMGIVVHDHVIIGGTGHVSLRAKGLI
ncbi:DNA repair protein RadC [Qipengyuania sp.]|uniref:RadC family protein n=1 Tax=Qipengyuania sp. TaxID=2004515 RepID=UPI0035C7D4C2